MRVFPACLQAAAITACTVITGLAARLRHSASRAAVPRHRPEPGIGGVKALSGQPDGRPPAKVPVLRSAPGSSRGASAGAQGCATAQSCA